jgi:hypothetical protein
MSKYTVKQVKPTGEAPSSFGTKYHVRFNEDDRTVTVTKKTEVTVGQELDGDIKENSYGAYFKSAPREFTPAPKAAFTPKNSDGQRQGMCINNAASFVNVAGDASMEAQAWADMVHAYASALYNKGDLTAATIPPKEEPLVDPFA